MLMKSPMPTTASQTAGASSRRPLRLSLAARDAALQGDQASARHRALGRSGRSPAGRYRTDARRCAPCQRTANLARSVRNAPAPCGLNRAESPCARRADRSRSRQLERTGPTCPASSPATNRACLPRLAAHSCGSLGPRLHVANRGTQAPVRRFPSKLCATLARRGDCAWT